MWNLEKFGGEELGVPGKGRVAGAWGFGRKMRQKVHREQGDAEVFRNSKSGQGQAISMQGMGGSIRNPHSLGVREGRIHLPDHPLLPSNCRITPHWDLIPPHPSYKHCPMIWVGFEERCDSGRAGMRRGELGKGLWEGGAGFGPCLYAGLGAGKGTGSP